MTNPNPKKAKPKKQTTIKDITISLRYQLTKNYQVVELQAEIPSNNFELYATKLLATAKEELEKISNINVPIAEHHPPSKSPTFSPSIQYPSPQYPAQRPSFNPHYGHIPPTQKNPNEWAINSKGAPILSIDKIPLLNGDLAKCAKNNVKAWHIRKVDIDNLPI